MRSDRKARKAVVVGAGPVGCLAALALVKQGWVVDIYEGRSDMRLPSLSSSDSLRSINLAISARGICAIRAIDPDVADRFLENVIPMKGRMIHDKFGRQQSQLYDRDGQCINSIDRKLLNEGLLEDVLTHPEINVFFQHKLSTADFDKRTLTFHNLDSKSGHAEVQVDFDFCIGADGSYSNVRLQLMRSVRMDYQQTYIPHEYLELRMPAGKDTEGNSVFLLDPNHLHIWPRHSFMLIALPNKDKTFTCTLFAPTTEFEKLANAEHSLKWFESHFPDALPLIGEQAVLEDFRNNPRSPLIAIKANPYHYKDRVIILGDAAHSMVPFFGQGLNCGLEDVRILDVLLRKAGVEPTAFLDDNTSEDTQLMSALHCYTESRHKDLVAISDLAMANYVEMRHSVATPSYLFRRGLDNAFSLLTFMIKITPSLIEPLLSQTPFPSSSPSGWIPLYTMITFRPDISYSTAKEKAERQQKIVSSFGWCVFVAGVASLGFGALKLVRHSRFMN
ncbi:FAD NAD-P-binding domain-containing [Pyrrhoderma noxium]|uniref:Kynurenine 3-monooxygenase n=1 Tax=Pyrrhoderma noxium TaxID=2282107 RepID=A0A286UW13_9AGAM|nr:FAD NAD-P-binding domain-containing [Pyrrhoderma noxium]